MSVDIDKFIKDYVNIANDMSIIEAVILSLSEEELKKNTKEMCSIVKKLHGIKNNLDLRG